MATTRRSALFVTPFVIAAIGLIGEVLKEHFPKTGDDTNEIPDKLIEL